LSLKSPYCKESTIDTAKAVFFFVNKA